MAEKIAMPGDPDGETEKLKQERKSAADEMRAAAAKKTTTKSAEKTADAKDEKKNNFDGPTAKDAAEGRGLAHPQQFDGDGWGDVPLQMRG